MAPAPLAPSVPSGTPSGRSAIDHSAPTISFNQLRLLLLHTIRIELSRLEGRKGPWAPLPACLSVSAREKFTCLFMCRQTRWVRACSSTFPSRRALAALHNKHTGALLDLALARTHREEARACIAGLQHGDPLRS
jgi:hypothetical protein